MNGLNSWLNWYYTNCQKQIILVYRGDLQENWAKRCLYLDNKFQPKLPYNHRSVLDCEIVLEYDLSNPTLNEVLATKLCKKLTKDGIKYSKHFSGGKSVHVHFLFKSHNVKNPALLKSTIMKHYGTFYLDETTQTIFDTPPGDRETRKVYPDLRLASSGHLIRAEHGVHEKTQANKTLLFKSADYPCFSILPISLWEEYERAQKFSVAVRIGQQTSNMHENPLVKELLDTVQFKENFDDGRERAMFALIHILKPKYTNKEDLIEFLWEWYCYSSSQGAKLSEQDVRNKVRYHWNRDYNINEGFIKRLIDEIKIVHEGKNKDI